MLRYVGSPLLFVGLDDLYVCVNNLNLHLRLYKSDIALEISVKVDIEPDHAAD